MSIIKNHELFPQEGDDPAVEVESIQVYKVDRGARVYRANIPAQDLTSEDQIQRQFGDGTYELWARARNKITRKRTLIFGDATPQAAPLPGTGNAGLFGSSPDLNVQLIQILMQSAQAQSTQMLTMMTGFMQAADAKNQQMMLMMMESSKSQVAVMTEYFKASQSQASGGAGSAKEVFGMFKEGMQFAKENAPALSKAGEKAGLSGTIDAAANMLGAISVAKQSGALSDLMGMLAPQAPQAPPSAPPAPHAAPPRALPPRPPQAQPAASAASVTPIRPAAPPAASRPPGATPSPAAAPPRPPLAASPPSDLPSEPLPAHTAPRTIVQVPSLRPRMTPPHGPTPPAEAARAHA